MNAATHTELAEVAKTQSAVDAMALVTLSPEKYAAEVYEPFKTKLTSAIDSVRAIDYDIKTTAGMDAAVKCRALFRDMRIAADKERKARKEPITKIGKLLESGFDQVEERITPLEELFDADIAAEVERKEAEKAAKIAQERARTEAIQARIAAIIAIPADVAGMQSSYIGDEIDALRDLEIDDTFDTFRPAAEAAKADTMVKLQAMFEKAKAAELEAIAAEQARIAEAARLEAQRVENARVAAENERIANEQAAERQRLADLAAAQALAAKELADKAAANIKADRDAQELAMKIEREANAKAQAERDRVAADLKRQLDEQQAAIAAERKAMDDEREAVKAARELAVQVEADHAAALIDNAEYDAADLARCAETAQAMLTNGRSLVAQSVEAYADAGLDDDELSNAEIAAMGDECGMSLIAWVERLEEFTVWARAEMEVAA